MHYINTITNKKQMIKEINMPKVKNETQIKLDSNAKVVMFNTELLGQFSDGRWSNTRKTNWQWYSKAILDTNSGTTNRITANLDNVQAQVAQYGRRGYFPYSLNVATMAKAYNCNDSELLTFVGNRIQAFGTYAIAFETAEINYQLSIFLEEISGRDCGIEDFKNAKARFVKLDKTIVERAIEELSNDANRTDSGDYYIRKKEQVLSEIERLGGLDKFIETFNSVDYSLKDMRRDLREITLALKTVFCS
jgi:hypothetical protein